MTTRVPIGVFFALFTISGFAGLIYESIWSHYLKLFLGHAAYAQTLVLAIFMGGMALGSWLVSRFTHRIANILLGYALAELGIGALALAFHGTFQATTGWVLNSVFPALGASAMVDVVKWTLASLLILPASLLLGTTFPLMSAGVIRIYPDDGGRALSMLYFTNSLGAAIGVLASGFVLIAAVGLPGTILTAGLLNVLLAAIVWMIARKMPAASVSVRESAAVASLPRDSLTQAVLMLAFATGAASFVYEITWIRMLATGLGASTHAFEVMLCAFILGMALGAYALRNRIERLSTGVGWLAGILVAKAFLAVYAVWIYGDVLEFIRWVMVATSRTNEGYVISTVAGLLASMTVMFPCAFCAGMTLPLATRILNRRARGEAAIGQVYAANTAGCILGAAFATHLGMEWLGVKNLTGLGALLDIAAAILMVAVGVEARGRPRALTACAGVCLVGAAGFASIQLDLLKMSSGVFRYGAFEDPRASEVLFYRDGKTASISVIDHPGIARSIRTNGKTDAALSMDGRNAGPDEPTMVLAGALPLAMKPDAALVANIGFGSGLTTHSLLGSPRVRQVDSIEIERMMIEGARLFMPRNRRAYEDARSQIHIDDAKTFFATRGVRYDIIVSEPSNPWVSGVATLFSEEFYGQVRRHLRDDGLFVQWIQSYDISVNLLATIFKAMGHHFGEYRIYQGGAVDLLIIATPGPRLPALSEEVFGFPGTGADLKQLGIRDVSDLQALQVAGRRAIEPLFALSEFPPNSDYFPVLDQNAPLARFRGDTAAEMRTSRGSLVPVLAMLEGETRTPLSRLARGDPNRPRRIDDALAGAEAIGIFLTGRADDARLLPTEDRSLALLGYRLLDACRGGEAQWVDAVARVVALSSPFLQRDDVHVVFERVHASSCWRSLPPTHRSHVRLLEAINDRDGERMSREGESLLEASDAGAAVHGEALLAALTGYIARGRLAEARSLWTRYERRLASDTRKSFPVRLLYAHLIEAAVR